MASIHPAEVQKRLGTIRGTLPLRGPKNTLSVCMIVKNEEQNIARAIQSFLPFADEIIVNDTGSTDRTLEILQGFEKVRIIHSEWKKDFSYSRNLSLNEARSAWILWMDADDFVPEDQVINFNKLKKAPLDRAFGFQVINTQSGLPIGARFLQLRMFPNHPKIRFERCIHEQIVFSLAALGLHTIYTEAVIWHMGYEKEEDRKSKSLRNLDILIHEPDRGSDPVISTQLGDAYAILERWDEAIEAYKEVLEIPKSKQINPDSWREVFLTIGKSYLSKGDTSSAKEWLEKAVIENSGRLDPIFHLGECALKQKNTSQAWEYFEKGLAMERTHSSQASHYEVMRMYMYKYMCDLATAKKDAQAVLNIAEKFLAEFPMVIEASHYVGKSYLALGNHAQAIFYLEKGIAADPKISKDVWFALILAYEQSGNSTKVAEAKRRMAQVFGGPIHQQERILLSIVLIVKNEQDHLEACLSSIRGLGDELIVVDTGSEDHTVAIAQKHGARVVDFPWQNDFSLARNRSIDEAKGKWILWLDADDILLEADRQAIRRLVETREPVSAFGFMIKNSQDGGVTGPVFNQIRLFPNRPEIRFEGRVHEQVMPSLQRLQMPIEFLTLRVIHTGYTDLETIQKKQKRNLELMQQDIALSPDLVNAMKYFAIGNAYLDLGDYKLAEEWYRKSMEQSERIGEDRHILEIAPVKIAECRANLGEHEIAHEMLKSYLTRYPTQPTALYIFAQLQVHVGLEKEAMWTYGRLLHFQEQPTLMPVDYQQIKVKACKILAEYWNRMGQSNLAIEILKMGIAAGKGEVVHGSKLASLYFDLEEYSFARDSLEMAKIIENTPSITLALAKSCIMDSKIERSLELLQEGVRLYPRDLELANLLKNLRLDLGL